MYELHVSCHLDDIDIKDWKSGDDEIECRIGFYYNAKPDDIIDWMVMKMQFNNPPNESTLVNPLWTCVDGVSTFENYL